MDLLKCIRNSPKLGKMKKNHFLLQPNSRFGSQFGYSSPSLLEANTHKKTFILKTPWQRLTLTDFLMILVRFWVAKSLVCHSKSHLLCHIDILGFWHKISFSDSILFHWRAFETWRYQKEFYRYFIRFNEKSFWTKNVVGFCIDFWRITYVFLLSRHEQVLKVGLFGALKSRLRLKLVMLSLVLKFLLMQC